MEVVSPRRTEVWWADLGRPRGSGPGYRRPVVVVSSDRFNRSRIQTVVVAPITSSARVAAAPGNVPLEAGVAGLDRACAINVSQLLALDKADLVELSGRLTGSAARELDAGLRLVLAL